MGREAGVGEEWQAVASVYGQGEVGEPRGGEHLGVLVRGGHCCSSFLLLLLLFSFFFFGRV